MTQRKARPVERLAGPFASLGNEGLLHADRDALLVETGSFVLHRLGLAVEA